MAELARGTVGDRPWGRTIATMAARGLTGQLNLYAPDGKVFQIAFEGGAITNAMSPLPSDSAARVALTLQLVSSMQVQMLFLRAQQQQRDEVEVIAEYARLAPEVATRLRRRTVATRAARTFALEQGDFVIDDIIDLPYFPGSELDSRGVIFMGASTLMTAERLAAELARLGSFYQLRQEVIPELAQFGFTDSERPILEAMVQGAQLAQLERIRDPRIVRAVVYALATAGACLDQAAAPPPPRPQQVARVAVRQVPTPPPQPTAMPDTFTQARVAARAGGDGLEMPTLRREIKSGRIVKPAAPPPPDDDLLDLEAPTHEPQTIRKPLPTQAPQSRATFSNPQTPTPPQPTRVPSRASFSGGGLPPAPAPRAPQPPQPPPNRTQFTTNPRATLSGGAPQPKAAFGTSQPNRAPQATTLPPAPAPRMPSMPRPRTAQQLQMSTDTQALIAERIKLVDTHADHFTMLGLKDNASDEQVRKAYFQLARQLHPDKLASLGIVDEQRNGQRLFAQVNTAFGVLSDPRRRQEYVALQRRGGEAAIRAEQEQANELANRAFAAEDAYERGKRALRQDAIPVAISELRKANELQPNEAEYMSLLAWAEFLAAPDKMAVAQNTRGRFARAVQRAPQSSTPRFYLARLERMLGRDAEALRVFEAVLQIDPNHAEAIAEVRVLKQRLKK